MLGLRNLNLELQTAQRQVKHWESEYNFAATNADRGQASRRFHHWQKKVQEIKDQILLIGCHKEFSMIKFGDDHIFYPTHDDGEIKLLMERDYSAIAEYQVFKLLTGVIYPST